MKLTALILTNEDIKKLLSMKDTLRVAGEAVKAQEAGRTQMPAKIYIKLVIRAQKIRHHRTKSDAVTIALKEYIAQKKQQEIIGLFGKIDFDERYDYKKSRIR